MKVDRIKLTAIFDKDNYTFSEFENLIAFLTQNEEIHRLRWLKKSAFVKVKEPLPVQFIMFSTEQAYYDENFIGLQIQQTPADDR